MVAEKNTEYIQTFLGYPFYKSDCLIWTTWHFSVWLFCRVRIHPWPLVLFDLVWAGFLLVLCQA